MLICLDLCHVLPCAIVTLLSLYLSFLCFGLLVQTRSRPYGLCHCPYTLAYIKGFGSPLFACLCLLASMLHACVSLSCPRLCHAWHPLWVCGCVVASDPQEAMFGCNYLGGIFECQVAPCAPFPFPLRAMICLPCLFVPLVGFLHIFTCLLTCPCMSLAC